MRRLFVTAALVLAAGPLGSCVSPLANLANLDLPTALFESAGRVDWAALLKDAPNILNQRCNELEQQEIAVDEEVGLGGAVAVNWMKTGGGLLHDAFDAKREPSASALSRPRNRMNVYVNTVGKNLAMQSSRPLLDWTFGVLDSPHFNAFSAPGGYVMVTRGLLRQVSNEAQLAGVLAHEISHVTERHALAAYKKLRQDECQDSAGKAAGLVLGALGGEGAKAALQRALGAVGMSFLNTAGKVGFNLNDPDNFALLNSLTDGLVGTIDEKGFDQQQELEADKLAVELMARAGYNPEEYIKFLSKIPAGGSGNVSHHPPTAERQRVLAAYLKELKRDELLAADARPFSAYAKVPLTGELAAAR